MYYRGAQAAIVVYDIQNQDSFQRAKTWVKELQRQVSDYLLTSQPFSLFSQKKQKLISKHFVFSGFTEHRHSFGWKQS